ncbi:MAG: hypothetical protein UV63_C0016G0005 [Microgenomates group bacterium GW2011_GWC1_43_11]|uniref:DUF6922 domain-containing protein n=2 Tax=Candidatus Gottesmaniibacteriota TaxID=1752720 RepID=A0A0G1KY88_9BACT|nr:MAG: hypothetical protein UV63_C0016G0005 [Microgenomates group bacterium GW2011_GWC1_43_11]KKT37537.1 MAG: hypothetical protein UW22_C0024G0004 [Candidatus Gottesmanbacteria bacterium GW2011_GWB1_44_11c]KKT61307.1 MAG: hypothetical protein UW52_C0006G0028 [Candidatus Gottesmanbacteria bacterium GW2011_GWA1_44_24b]HCM82547.1 hypothetical protein [Patescibacteria group bacterium]
MNHPPVTLQPFLSSLNVDRLDIEKDDTYIIHQILAYGSIDALIWLFATYPKDHIQRVFCDAPYKDYRPSRFHFVISVLLSLEDRDIDKRNYVKNIPRHFG